MSCCPTSTDGNTLASPVVYELPLTNLADNGGVLTRNGGVAGTGDAFANSSQWCEGTGCGWWVWTIDNSNYVSPGVGDEESNELFFLIYPEDGSVNGYGWYFTNATVSFRRAPFVNGAVSGFPIYYRNAPSAPGGLGYNHFAIEWNNGTLRLWETSEFGSVDPQWVPGGSYSYTGLPTGTRWRLRIYVKPAAADAWTPVASEVFGAAGDDCVVGNWEIPALQWSASMEVATIARGVVATKRFDAGTGSSYYLVAQVDDAGNELRSKNLKSIRTTGRKTNSSGMVYGYDVNQEIDVEDLEAGTRANTRMTTRPQDFTDSTGVTQSERKPINIANAVLSTVRIEGDDTGNEQRDRIDEIVVEQSIQGVRR